MPGANSIPNRPGTLPVLPASLLMNPTARVTVSISAPAGFEAYDVPLSRFGARSVAPVNGVAQVETATVVVATASTAGTFGVTVASSLFKVSLIVPVVLTGADSTALAVAAKIRTALSANTTIAANFVVSGAGAAVILTAIVARANDLVLKVSWLGLQGITALPASTDTTAGVSGTVPEYLGQMAVAAGVVKVAVDISLNTWVQVS